jgi:phosphoenolpyruvate---glycerone phosphotransferase subunit DhaL
MTPSTTLIDCIQHATQTLIDHVEELTELDSAIGDGDHGLNMKRGSLAIQGKLASLQGQPMDAVLKTLGMTCMSMVGGSSGPVFGTLLVTLGKELPQASTPADAANALQAGIGALMRLGKAEVGHKTLLDVLDPVRRLLAEMPATLPRTEQLAQLKQCALDAAEATKHLAAMKGRASFLGERADGHMDPGSRSMALIIGAVCDRFPTA